MAVGVYTAPTGSSSGHTNTAYLIEKSISLVGEGDAKGGNPANRVTLQPPSSGSNGRMIYVRNAANVRIENLYIEINHSVTKEGVLAIGLVNGLIVKNNYLSVTSSGTGLSRNAISINPMSNGDRSTTEGATASYGQLSTITGNTIYATTSALGARGILVEGGGSTITSNTVHGASTNDMRVRWNSGGSLLIEGNSFGGRGVNVVEPSVAVTVKNNAFTTLAAGAEYHSDLADYYQLRFDMAPGSKVQGNTFSGYGRYARAVYVERSTGVEFTDNVFTPKSTGTDFDSIGVLIENKSANTANPAYPPTEISARFLRNTFNGRGTANSGFAVGLLNSNDPNGNTATFGNIQFGSSDVADANHFDSNLKWYIYLGDLRCNTGSTAAPGKCPVSNNMVYRDYGTTGGNASTNSQAWPFRGNVAARNNVFGGKLVSAMTPAEYTAVGSRIHDQADKPALGVVDFGDGPTDISLTVTADAANTNRTGSFQVLDGVAANAGAAPAENVKMSLAITRVDGGSIVMDGNPLVDGAGDSVLMEFQDAGCTIASGNPHDGWCLYRLTLSPDGKTLSATFPQISAGFPANAGNFHVYRQRAEFRVPGGYRIAQTVFGETSNTVYASAESTLAVKQALSVAITGNNPTGYNGSPQPLGISVSPASNPAVVDLAIKAELTYASSTTAPTNAGTYPVIAISTDADYVIEPAATTSYVVSKAAGQVEWGTLDFAYDRSSHAVTARIRENGHACTVAPASVGPAIGRYPVSASCNDPNYDASGSATASIGGGNRVHVLESDRYFLSVADALADASTTNGMTIEMAPGVSSEPIVLTKSVKLIGSRDFTPPASRATLNAGPATPPVTILDGGNVATDGIVVANDVKDASISGFEIRNFTRHCIAANHGNDGLSVADNVVHGCGGRGISVSGIAVAGITNVSIERNEVYATGDRGIVVWDGIKRDITISNNNVHDLAGCCGIELQDGTATGVTVTDNVVANTGDSGMSFIQLTSGSPTDRPNTIARNDISNNGRFGMEIKIPNGSGAATGDGAIVVEGNVIVASASAANPRDRAGIAVIRRSLSAAYPFEVDATSGVIVRNNNVSGFTNANAGYQGYGIVVEGLNSTVSGNTLANNGIGLQIQQGNPNGTPPGDSNQDAQSDWFGRGNATTTCVSVGQGADANIISGSALIGQRQVPAGAPMIGQGVTNEATHARYCSINAAIAAASAGDVISVAAGTYAEDVVIDKTITLKGAKAGVNAGVGSSRDPSSGESIIVPATAESGLAANSSGRSVVKINSDDVILDGFVIDTDNPGINSGFDLNGAGPDVSSGVFANGNRIALQNLVVRNALYAGIDGGHDALPAQDGNLVRNNRMVNFGTTSFGIGVLLEKNFYAKVTGNRMESVRTGVQLNNNRLAAPTPGYVPEITGNQIQAKRLGIWANLFTDNAPTYRIADNAISGVPSSQAGQWNGLWVESMMGAQTIVIENNTIDGSAVVGRTRVGYLLNYIPSSKAKDTAIDGGRVDNVEIGVLATDATVYAGAVDDFVVRNVAFANVSQGAFYVEDTMQVAGSAKLTVGNGNTYSNVGHKLVLSGSAPVAMGSFDDVLVRSARPFVLGALTSDGNPYCNTQVCQVANASINAGIAAATAGGIVTVEDGTFIENVVVNKAISLRGPHAGIAGDNVGRGVGEAIVAPASGTALTLSASNATIDGLEMGHVTANRVVFKDSAGAVGTLTGVRFINNRLVDYTASNSTSAAIFMSGSATVPATRGMEISGNLFQDLKNGIAGSFAMGIRVAGNANLQITDNVFRRVQSNAMQLTSIDAAQVRGNRIDGGSTNYTNVGIQVTFGNDIAIEKNEFNNTLQGFLFNANSGTGVSFTCNTVAASAYGVRAASYGTTGPTVSPVVLHNFLNTTTSLRNDDLAGNVIIGSNYYGGGAATRSGNLLIADALVANPIGNAACGNNAPTQLVAYANSSPQSTPVSTPFGSDLHARVQDVLGGAVAGQPVTFSAPASGASAVLGTSSGTTNYNGEVISTATANATAGSYNVGADSGSWHADFALTNTPGAATVTLGDLSQVYDGSPRAVSVTTNPPGLTTLIVYAPAGHTNAGSYAVTATITDPNYSGSATGTLVITRAAGTVAWGSTSFVYDGTSPTVSAHIAEEPASTCTVSGTVGPNVGNYPVSAVCTGSNYDASGNTTVGITAQPSTITLSHLNQPYDGTPKSVVATTAPTAAVAVAVTYDGSSTPPTAVGTYAVTASVTDPNYSAATVTGTLQIVPGNGDIALVLNGPVDPVHVGDKAQYAATMLANPALHAGESYGYKITLSKSGGTRPLELADLASMEVFYQGNWVDAQSAFGAIPFAFDGSGDLVYQFPDGIPGYPAGFPIEDPSWTWNFRFSFADTGTYTTTAELVDGVSKVAITPAVTASIATVVEAALPPTDIHLVLAGPADHVTLGAPAEYTGTLLADPALHTGETFFVKVTIGKNGGAMTSADFSSMQIFLGGQWVDGSDLGVVFQDDGHGNLVYLFPESQMPGGFPIEDPQWSWNFRFVYANTGVYTATAQVIPAYQAQMANPDVLASAAIATTVVAAQVIPPDMKLLLIGPVDEVQVGAPAAYAGTMLANPVDFSGREFWVRVRLSKDGGASQMTVADLTSMELYNGGAWQDATSILQPHFQQVGNDLVYLFPQPNGAFPIVDATWTWHFRFSYGSAGVYDAVADVVDAADANPLAAASLANATVQTTVVPQAAQIALALQGPVVGTVGEALRYTGTLTANPLPDARDLFFVHIKLSKDGGAAQMTAADLAKMEISLDGGASWIERNDLPLVQNGNLLEYDFPQPDLPGGFPITGSWTWDFRFTYANAATYSADATVVTADGSATPVSNTAHVVTQVAAQSPDISLQLNGPVAGIHVGEAAQYVGTLRADPLPDPSELFFVEVRLHKSTGAMQVSDLSKMELYQGGAWQDATAQLQPELVPDGGDLVYLFPKPIAANGFPIDAAQWSWQFRFTYADAATYTATARVLRASDLSQASAPVAISTEVVAQSPDVSLQLNGPMADVQVDVPASYIGRLTNHGPALAENAFVKVRVELDGGTLSAADVTTEVWFGGSWVAGSLTEVNGGLEVDFPDSAGFPVDAGFDYTHQFRITYHKPGLFNAAATLVGANSSDVYATSAMYTEVVARSAVTASVLIDPASLRVVYDGQLHAATVTTTPAVQSVAITYNGSATAPTDAGTYVVVANVVDTLYVGSASAILVIDKAPSTITLNAVDLQQSLPVHAVAAVANPMTAGASIAVSYNGNAALPTAPGTYTVVAILDDPNYVGSASATLVVSDGAAVSISIDSAPAMAFVGANAPYTDLLDYLGSVGNSGSQTAQAVHFELTVVRIDDGNGTSGQPLAIAAEDVLACLYDPSGWAAQEPGNHHGCPQDYNSLFLSQSAGSFNGRPSTSFRYPNLAANDAPLPHIDPAMPLAVKFAFKRGQYQVHSRVVGADGTVYATSATAGTTVPDIALGYNGPTTGQVEDALLSQSTLTNAGGRVDGKVIVRLTLSDDGSALLAPTDATLSYQFGGQFVALPWTQAGNNLVTYFGPPTGFALEDGHNGITSGQDVFHREGNYRLVYEVVDVATQQVYASSHTAFAIGPNQIAFDVSGLNPVYTGSPLPVTVVPGTVPHTVVYEPAVGGTCPSAPTGSNTVPPTNAGSYCVYVDATAPYSGGWSGMLVIAKATASLAIDGAVGNVVSRTFDGAAQVVTATTSPALLGYTMTYNGDANAPTAAGSYALLATIDDPNHSGIATGTLVVSTNGGAVIVLDDNDGTADGTIHRSFTGSAVAPVTATTTPAGVGYAVTYVGVGSTVYPLTATPPTAVGQYHVVATTTNTNYAAVSASGTLVIDAAGASIALDTATLNATYDGNPHAVTATTMPGGLAYSVTYNGLLDPPSAVGSYTVVATIDDPNHAAAQATGTLVIGAASASITLDAATLSATYDGNPHAVTATTTPSGLAYSVTYNGLLDPPSAAGSYAVVATIDDPDHVAAPATGTLVISTASVAIVFDAATLSATYDGQLHAVTATTTPVGLAYKVTYDGNANPPVNAGSYPVVATITAPGRSGTVSGTLVITKAVGAVNFGSTNFTFDGLPHVTTAVISQEPANGAACTLTASAGDYPRTSAGSSTLNAVCSGSNYTANGSTTLVVSPKPVTIALTGTGSFPYDGNAHAATASVAGAVAGFPATAVVAYEPGGSSAPVAVGSYGVTASIAAGGNYAAAPASGVITIGSANATVTLGNLSQVYDGMPRAVTVSTNPSGLATSVSYDGSPTAPTNAGTYTVVATITAPGHSGTASGTLVVAKATATVSLSNLAWVYDGTPRSATATVTPSGLALRVAYDDSLTAPTNAGSYAVVAVVTDANHSGSASATMTIAKAAATVSITNTTQVFDGSPKPVTVATTPSGLKVVVTYDGSATAPSAIGRYLVAASIDDANHAGSASATLDIVAGTASAMVANGATAFTGVAGRSLSGALPSVKVTDAHGNALAGVSVTFAAGASSGTLSGAVQLTNSAGIATLAGWVLDPTPGTNTVTASATGVTGTVSFTATGTSANGALKVTITDGRQFVRVGQSFTYAITVGNSGSSNMASVAVSNVLPPELDATATTWQCVPLNGATCSNGSGSLVDAVTLPAGSSAVYMLSTKAVRGPSDRITNTVTATGPDGAVSATDTTDMVIFRNGFEGGDGSEAVGDELSAIGQLGSASTVSLAVDANALGSLRPVTLASARDGTFRVEAIRIDDQVWVRLVARAGAVEQATAWSPLDGSQVMFALEGGNLLLAGAASDLQLPLDRLGSFAIDGMRH